jgi:hypothetical protein
MKRVYATFVAPLLAAVLLAVMLVQTRGALRASGTWTRSGSEARTPVADPYAALDRLITEAGGAAPAALARDPFALGPVVSAADPDRPKPPPRPAAPPPAPPMPVLTAIVWDNDPRATIRWDGRDYSVRENTLFADFRVASISRDAVVLEHGGERLVLALPRKGD